MNIIDQLPGWAWLVLVALALVLGLVIKKTGIRLPKVVQDLLRDPDVIAAVKQGIQLARELKGASDDERRAMAVGHLKNMFYSMTKIMLSDSAADLLVQLVYSREKLEGE